MKATCTWGDGPDVLIELKGTSVMCYEEPKDLDRAVHGFVSQGSLDLSIKEADIFLVELAKAISWAKELQAGWEEAMYVPKS